jgi:hypothetical protein
VLPAALTAENKNAPSAGASRNTATTAASITQEGVDADGVEVGIKMSGIAKGGYAEHYVEVAVVGHFNVGVFELVKTKQVEAFLTLGQQHTLLPNGQYRCGFVIEGKRAFHAGTISTNFLSFSYEKK